MMTPQQVVDVDVKAVVEASFQKVGKEKREAEVAETDAEYKFIPKS